MSVSENKEISVVTADPDIWDDSLLIKAYDASINLAKEELAKRIANATNSKSSSSVSQNQGAVGGRELNDMIIENDEKQILKLGDYVRATYDDDIDYEAKIIHIDEINDTCTVKYIGYDNEQNVQLSNLIPSWGKKSRRLQFAKAKQGKDMNAKEKSHGKKSKLYKQQPNLMNINSSSYFNQLPPPPPMPPMLNELNEDSEHISAMLMSWYMSGYYTGLYQGQKLAKSTKPKNNKSKEK